MMVFNHVASILSSKVRLELLNTSFSVTDLI